VGRKYLFRCLHQVMLKAVTLITYALVRILSKNATKQSSAVFLLMSFILQLGQRHIMYIVNVYIVIGNTSALDCT
jgi:predicted ferric reductase